jgi:GGDEF domain-containing protein
LKFTHHDGIEEEVERRIRDHAKRDSLTGLYRREYFEEQLHTEFSYAHRHGEPLALFLIDVDELEDLNARWTRLSGDVVLALITRRLEPATRRSTTTVPSSSNSYIPRSRQRKQTVHRIGSTPVRIRSAP